MSVLEIVIIEVYGAEWNESDLGSFGVFDDVPPLDKEVCDGL